jgi:hypothetical protein
MGKSVLRGGESVPRNAVKHGLSARQEGDYRRPEKLRQWMTSGSSDHPNVAQAARDGAAARCYLERVAAARLEVEACVMQLLENFLRDRASLEETAPAMIEELKRLGYLQRYQIRAERRWHGALDDLHRSVSGELASRPPGAPGWPR